MVVPRLSRVVSGCLLLSCLTVGGGVLAFGGARQHRASSASPCGSTHAAPRYRHVIWILMENRSYKGVIGSAAAPYLNSLARACGVASNYHNITHHSLANYIGLTNGASLAALRPFYTDCSPPSRTCESTGANLFEQNTSWRSYEESMPSACDKKGTSIYADRHNPALYYTDLTNCRTNDVPRGTTSSSALLKAFSSQATAPAFSFVTPNLCDDMHGVPGVCGQNLVQRADSWLQTWVGRLTSSAVYASGDTVIFIVWDEGSGGFTGEPCFDNTTDQSCHVPLIVVAPSVKAGTNDGGMLNHYSLLKTTEDLLGYPELGEAKAAASMAAAFNI